jgi:hypothetical protein
MEHELDNIFRSMSLKQSIRKALCGEGKLNIDRFFEPFPCCSGKNALFV